MTTTAATSKRICLGGNRAAVFTFYTQFTVDALLGLEGATDATAAEYIFYVVLFSEEAAGGEVFHYYLCSQMLL